MSLFLKSKKLLLRQVLIWLIEQNSSVTLNLYKPGFDCLVWTKLPKSISALRHLIERIAVCRRTHVKQGKLIHLFVTRQAISMASGISEVTTSSGLPLAWHQWINYHSNTKKDVARGLRKKTCSLYEFIAWWAAVMWHGGFINTLLQEK